MSKKNNTRLNKYFVTRVIGTKRDNQWSDFTDKKVSPKFLYQHSLSSNLPNYSQCEYKLIPKNHPSVDLVQNDT